MISRLEIDEYYMAIAFKTAKRSTCPKASVGAILVTEDKSNIISIGYNGAPKGLAHCTDVGCIISDDKCIRVIHAEANCLLKAKEISKATLYVTHIPCLACANLIINSGIARVVVSEHYYDKRCELFGLSSQLEYLINGGIQVSQVHISELER